MAKQKYYNNENYHADRPNKIRFDDNPEQMELRRLIEDNKTKVIFCTGNAGTGKALLNGTPVLTSIGWKNIEDLSLDDLVAGKDGNFYNITGIYPQGQKDIYRVTFSDRTYVDCCEEHLWSIQTRSERGNKKGLQKNQYFPHTVTTKQLMEDYNLRQGNAANIFIPMCEPINFVEQEHFIHPYVLGCLLGDGYIGEEGSMSFINDDQDVLDRFDALIKQNNMCLRNNYSHHYYLRKMDDQHGMSEFKKELYRLGLLGTNSSTKFIPEEYLIDSVSNRLELLKGIIDTDGYCEGSSYDIVLKSEQLIKDIQFIIESLGMTAVYTTKQSTCTNSPQGPKDCGIFHRLHIKTNELIQKIHFSKRRDQQWKKPQA